MDPRLAGLLSYLVPPITGIIFFLIEKRDDVVRWHAAQSIVFGIAWIAVWILFTILSTVLSTVIPFLGWIFGFLMMIVLVLGGLILWVVCLIKGYSGQKWRMPVLAPYADKIYGSGAAPGGSSV
ncbi:MAG: DUF4870 domain-containing protein [Gemmatimonadota bacterium]